MDINTGEGNYMSNVINYFLGNTIYILTLTRSGNPDNHPALLENMSPLQQWIFNDPNRAVEAAEAIYTSIDNKLRESGESELNPPVNLKEITAQSSDIMLALRFDDTDDDELYRIYITGFQKHGREWN